jgi:antitoxin CptB
MDETRQTRIRRLAMRSMRRGIREMDLILSAFAEGALAGMSEVDLALYEALLEESDHDLYLWVSGQEAPPAALAGLVARIAAVARGLTRPP